MLSWDGALFWMLLLLLRNITDECGVLSSTHLHQLLMVATHRCVSAARYVDDVVT